MALSPEFAATVTPATGALSAEESVYSSVPESSQHGRFLPGARIAGRYRIVSLVGRGGMGEVYRADDLKLGHTVALKFLPRDVADDPRRLEYFHSEVRLTRQISHPNVCRVYDIGEMDGQQFLSMEFIDGEDLRVLLRRIGRLPGDKGVELTQQLCSGLAAAHDLGVLHRDLKPANIMIDGRGQVRITDFGLARLANDVNTGEIAGTPAYMAPEQLTGGDTTIQSDLYSLGLILHELFTGQAVHSSTSLEDRLRKDTESSPSRPSRLLADLDASVERVMLQCLELEPQERPRSAHAIAAALPGGDPLAAALAAGETPSPELVAAAGKTGVQSLRAGIACLACVVIGMAILPYLTPYSESGNVPIHGQDPAKLIGDIQEDLLQPLGYFDPHNRPRQTFHGLQFDRSPGRSPQLNLWYRQSDDSPLIPKLRHLIRGRDAFDVTPYNPPPFDGGMTSVRVDMQGRLVELVAVPVAAGGLSAVEGLDDEALLTLAGCAPNDFDAARISDGVPRWKLPVFATTQVIYRNRDDDGRTGAVIARDQGRCVYFFIGSFEDPGARWFVPPGMRTQTRLEKNDRNPIIAIMHLLLLAVAIPLALHNVAAGRTDRRGALRYAMLVGGGLLLVWLIGVHHTTDINRELRYLRDFVHAWSGYTFRIWVYYLALEPYVRRYWPRALIAWTRALDGRLRDPLLGRDLLLGCAAGTACQLLTGVACMIASPEGRAVKADPNSLIWVGASAVSAVVSSIGLGLVFLLVLFLFRVFLRRPLAAFVAFTAVITVGEYGSLTSDAEPWVLIEMGLGTAVIGMMLTRFGLVASIATIICFTSTGNVPLVPQVTMWYGGATLVIGLLICSLATYGFVTGSLLPHVKHGGTGAASP